MADEVTGGDSSAPPTNRIAYVSVPAAPLALRVVGKTEFR